MARIVKLLSLLEGKEQHLLQKSASDVLLSGGVIAVPTDTIYGIAALSQDVEAINRIYNIKQRDLQKPIAISVGDIDDIYRWSKVTVNNDLLSELLPGPVTVVMERSEELNPRLNPDTNLIGVRIPDHKFIRSLAQQCRQPIALTSANISCDRSSLSVEEFKDLWPMLDLIIDGGILSSCGERSGSTVVDLSTSGFYRIIRQGSGYEETLKILHKHKLQEKL
ncbi:hypothetical protein SNE40_013427 [Patella caerulea]|uniref:Threonylcarbamoyl-AMP synthase n=1 Tax=Patella caerulea TaxID=87958 RepID=A0AAN8JG53_PATCE